MAKLLGVSRSGYYKYATGNASPRRIEDRRLLDEIKRIHAEFRSVYGVNRVHRELAKQGIHVGRKRVHRLMKNAGISGKKHRKFRVLTTDSMHEHRPSPDLLKRRFRASRPDRIWVSDITYIRVRDGWTYLCVILDLFSRRIVGWSIQSTLATKLVVSALDMAMQNRNPKRGLIFHSDRGVQYASKEFRRVLTANGFRQSMSRKGNCWDNAPAESVFATLKNELEANIFWSEQEARREIFDYIEEFYNTIRSHSHLGYMSPDEYEKQFAA